MTSNGDGRKLIEVQFTNRFGFMIYTERYVVVADSIEAGIKEVQGAIYSRDPSKYDRLANWVGAVVEKGYRRITGAYS